MSENGFQINTDVSVKQVRKKRRSKKKVAIRAAFIGTAVLLVLAIAFVIFGFTVPVSTVSIVDKRTKEYYSSERVEGVNEDKRVETEFYDKKGNVVKKTEDNSTGQVWLYNYTYKGNKLVREDSLCWGSPYSHTIYTYEGDQLVREEIYNTADNTLNAKTEYFYNADGTLYYKVEFDHIGPMCEYTYTYSDGKMATETRTDMATKNVTETTYLYQGENLVKETVVSNVNRENAITTVTDYMYDDRGNLIRETNDNGEFCLYKYSYSTKKVPLFD